MRVVCCCVLEFGGTFAKTKTPDDPPSVLRSWGPPLWDASPDFGRAISCGFLGSGENDFTFAFL